MFNAKLQLTMRKTNQEVSYSTLCELIREFINTGDKCRIETYIGELSESQVRRLQDLIDMHNSDYYDSRAVEEEVGLVATELADFNVLDFGLPEHLDVVETTSERNGYPRFLEDAIIGFTSWEEAKSFAYSHGLSLIWLDRRDGWNLWHRGDHATAPMELTEDDFPGYSMEKYRDNRDTEDLFEVMKDRIAEANSINEIRNILIRWEDTIEKVEDLEEGYAVLHDDGYYYETVKLNDVISCTDDTKHITLGAYKF